MTRVHLLEAEKLAQKDSFLGIRGKSDPYAKVSIGLQHFRSRTIYKNLNPTWNEVFEVRVSLATFDALGAPCWVQTREGLTRPCGNTGPEERPWGRAGWPALPVLPTPTRLQRWAAVALPEGQLINEFPLPFPIMVSFVGISEVRVKETTSESVVPKSSQPPLPEPQTRNSKFFTHNPYYPRAGPTACEVLQKPQAPCRQNTQQPPSPEHPTPVFPILQGRTPRPSGGALQRH